MYKKNLALNELQWLICHEIKPNQIKKIIKIKLSEFIHFVVEYF